jgi:hypothetical protein
MCPEKELISVYFDGELPSPWKEKLEVHLETCPECRSTLENYKETQALLHANDVAVPFHPVDEAGVSRLRRRPRTVRYSYVRSLMTRRLELPLPAAAAAALLVLGGVFVFGRVYNAPKTEVAVQKAAASEIPRILEADDYSDSAYAVSAIDNAFDFDSGDMRSLSSISDVIRLLDASAAGSFSDGQGSEYLIMRLPENKNFSSVGQPRLVTSGDYRSVSQGGAKR